MANNMTIKESPFKNWIWRRKKKNFQHIFISGFPLIDAPKILKKEKKVVNIIW